MFSHASFDAVLGRGESAQSDSSFRAEMTLYNLAYRDTAPLVCSTHAIFNPCLYILNLAIYIQARYSSLRIYLILSSNTTKLHSGTAPIPLCTRLQIKASYVPLSIADPKDAEGPPMAWIIPEWSEIVDPSAINIMLTPGVAFGTGECSHLS